MNEDDGRPIARHEDRESALISRNLKAWHVTLAGAGSPIQKPNARDMAKFRYLRESATPYQLLLRQVPILRLG